MSGTSTPTDSPVHVEPLHNPAYAAKVVVPQAPLGNATNGPLNALPGMGAKALLAKKMANANPKYISPTDNLMTPCSQKLTAAKKRHFVKGAKPMQQLSLVQEPASDELVKTSSDDESPQPQPEETIQLEETMEIDPLVGDEVIAETKTDDDENPF